MKIGDKLYCIKSLIMYDNFYFIKNKIYTINYIFPDGELGIKSSKKTSYTDNLCLYFNPQNPESNRYKFQDYFVTEIELRKLKLQKLNEKR